MISSGWREIVDPLLVNPETWVKLIILGEILKWSGFGEERKSIGRWSMTRYCWNLWSWGKFENDLNFMKIRSTLDIGRSWNIAEIHHLQRNSKTISSGSREEVHQMLVYHETLLRFTIMWGILKWSRLEKEKNYIGRWWMMKHGWSWSY